MIEVKPNHHEKQRDVFGKHNDDARLVIARCGRKFGKSRGSRAPIARGMAAGKVMAYIAPEYKYLSQWMNDFINIYLPAITRSARNEHAIEFVTGAQLDLWSLDNYDAIRPREYNVVVIDECAISRNYEDAWTQAIQPTLMKRKGTAWHLSTPKTDKGGQYFRRLWEQSAEYAKRYHYTSYDNPHLPVEELDRYKSQVSSRIFAQEALAEFVDAEGARIKREWYRHMIPDADYTVCVGVDLAISEAEDADFTALVALAVPEDKHRPRVVIGAERFRKSSLTEITQRIVAFCQRYGAEKCGIEDVAFQRIIVDDVRRAMPDIYVRGMPATKSKLSRFLPVEGRIEHGNIGFASTLPREFEESLLAFTGETKNEDDHYVDALVHADTLASKSTVGIFTI